MQLALAIGIAMRHELRPAIRAAVDHRRHAHEQALFAIALEVVHEAAELDIDRHRPRLVDHLAAGAGQNRDRLAAAMRVARAEAHARQCANRSAAQRGQGFAVCRPAPCERRRRRDAVLRQPRDPRQQARIMIGQLRPEFLAGRSVEEIAPARLRGVSVQAPLHPRRVELDEQNPRQLAMQLQMQRTHRRGMDDAALGLRKLGNRRKLGCQPRGVPRSQATQRSVEGLKCLRRHGSAQQH